MIRYGHEDVMKLLTAEMAKHSSLQYKELLRYSSYFENIRKILFFKLRENIFFNLFSEVDHVDGRKKKKPKWDVLRKSLVVKIKVIENYLHSLVLLPAASFR